MIPETEPTENIPQSLPSIKSVESIIEDLKNFDRHLAAEKANGLNQLNTMRNKVNQLELENERYRKVQEELKSEIKLLNEQNSKLKSDLEISDSDKTLFHKQYIQNGKEVRELKIETESLKEKIKKIVYSDSRSYEDYLADEILDSKITKMLENPALREKTIE